MLPEAPAGRNTKSMSEGAEGGRQAHARGQEAIPGRRDDPFRDGVDNGSGQVFPHLQQHQSWIKIPLLGRHDDRRLTVFLPDGQLPI